ncbi:MAG: hypothetical protein Q8O57_09555, partial [Kiritimatiellota bacterium]|nr:hypothetical protein [Kiritimatiellota bacterium]
MSMINMKDLVILTSAGLFFCAGAGMAADGLPQVGASSIWTDGPTLLYGKNLAGELQLFFYRDDTAWNDELVTASLRRVLARNAQPLALPDNKARWSKISSNDPYTLCAGVPNRARAVVLRNEHGMSAPYILTR